MMEAENYAVVDDDGNIVNVIIWDGVSQWSPPEGCTAVRCGENLCAIGGTYKDGKFTSPPAPELPDVDLVSQAEQLKVTLMSEATQQISILQDAVDLEMATDDEKLQLTAWKKYRVLLNRVDTSSSSISWPKKP